jgi:hypothetical protein
MPEKGLWRVGPWNGPRQASLSQPVDGHNVADLVPMIGKIQHVDFASEYNQKKGNSNENVRLSESALASLLGYFSS